MIAIHNIHCHINCTTSDSRHCGSLSNDNNQDEMECYNGLMNNSTADVNSAMAKTALLHLRQVKVDCGIVLRCPYTLDWG